MLRFVSRDFKLRLVGLIPHSPFNDYFKYRLKV